MEIKYTNDGKKVRIVGTLNSAETIVQEIYVDTTGAEIPSGENFVVKSLHDKPVKSWKQKEIEKWELEFKETRKRVSDKKCKLEDRIRETQRTIRASAQLEKYFKADKLKYLDLFLAGGISHYVSNSYGRIDIQEFTSANCNCDRDNMRLLTLYGSSNGELNWRLGMYSDHSGSSSEVWPCVSYEDALEKAQKMLDDEIAKRGVNQYSAQSAEKYGLQIPQDAIDTYHAKAIKSCRENVATIQKKLETAQRELAEAVRKRQP